MDQAKQEIAEALYKILKLPKADIALSLETPPDPKLGDYAFPCFPLSKILRKSPAEVAKDLKSELKLPKGSHINKVEVLGPYLNFFINPAKLADLAIKDILTHKECYGTKPLKKEVSVVESPSPNTNKPLHLGHLRNMALGQSLKRILEHQGYSTKLVNLINDRGVHISKSMLSYQKFGKGKSPDTKSDHFVGDYYVMFSKEAKKSKKWDEDAQKLLKKWEAGDKSTIALWKKMNKWVTDGHKQTYKDFNFKIDKTYLESDLYKHGKDIVLDGLKKGIFYKDDTGAIIADLTKYKLDKKVLMRADGTSLYITQDLYTAVKRYQDFKYSKSIYIVASEQDYHFRVLFKLLELLKQPAAKGTHHVSYGLVNLPSGRMKSREGTVVDADHLISELESIAKLEVEARNPNMFEKKLQDISHKIGLAAIKFFILKHTAHKDMIFNPEESISMEGETGPYLQYALVRARRILEKAKAKPKASDFKGSTITEPAEQMLIKKLAAFPKVVERALSDYSPHHLANYGLELASMFNKFYESVHVTRSKGDAKKSRLAMVLAYATVLDRVLWLLGIDEVERM